MSEKSFYISDDERGRLFEFITSINGIVIADKQRKTSDLEHVVGKNQFLDIIENECVGFFITSPDFTTQPLLSEQNRYLSEPSFSVRQRYGGPYIALSLYRGFAADDIIQYKRTDIFHYPRYIDFYNHSSEIPASNELRQYYKRIVEYLKSRCKAIDAGSMKYLISTDLINDLIKEK
jgi:hypothetical protein